jgi:hypothetical protein
MVREYLEGPRIGPDRNLVRYPELTAIPMLKRFDDYTKLICSELAKARAAAGTASPGDAAQAVEDRIAQEMTL